MGLAISRAGCSHHSVFIAHSMLLPSVFEFGVHQTEWSTIVLLVSQGTGRDWSLFGRFFLVGFLDSDLLGPLGSQRLCASLEP